MPRRAVRLPAVVVLVVLAAGRAAAGEAPLATDAIADDSPRAAFVWSYLCQGRPPQRPGDFLTCPCPDPSGVPRAPEAGEDIAATHVASLYLGSFTAPGKHQALVALGGCGSMNSPSALLTLEEQDGAWRKVAYQAPLETAGPADLHDVSSTCLAWTAPGARTRLVCDRAVAILGRNFAPAFALEVIYAVSFTGGAPVYTDLLHLADTTRGDCDAMPLRHLARLAAWRLDSAGPHPRLTLELQAGDKRTTQHGSTDACRADRPVAADVTLTLHWNGEAWNPTGDSAAEKRKLETIYQSLAKP